MSKNILGISKTFLEMFKKFLGFLREILTIRRPKISPPKVIYKVQSMPYKSLPLGAFWTIFGRNFPTGVPELLYPYQPANPLVESICKALKCLKNINKNRISSYIWATERRLLRYPPYQVWRKKRTRTRSQIRHPEVEQ